MFRSVRWYTHELERRERAWAAERAELVQTICHLSGKPIKVAPLVPRELPDPVPAAERFTLTPEQLPI